MCLPELDERYHRPGRLVRARRSDHQISGLAAKDHGEGPHQSVGLGKLAALAQDVDGAVHVLCILDKDLCGFAVETP